MNKDLYIKLATTEKEKWKIYSFRYSIYIEELNKSFLQHDQQQKILTDEYDVEPDVHQISLLNGDELVGCLRLRYPHANDPTLKSYLPAKSELKYRYSISDRLMIKKECRNTMAISLLMNYTYNKNIRDGIDFGLIEVEPHLIRLYSKFGFHIGKEIQNRYGQKRTLMFINARDGFHFQNIGSPYAKLFYDWTDDMNAELKREMSGDPSVPYLSELTPYYA